MDAPERGHAVKAPSPGPAAFGGLFGAGVVVGAGHWLSSRHQPPRPPGEVAVANAIHLLLAVVVAALVVVWARRDAAGLRRFLAWPFTPEGWRSLSFAALAVPLALWRLGTFARRRGTRGRDAVGLPVAVVSLVAAITMCYVPFRSGVQVLAGLDPNFTRDAWGGPSYLGAALAHWLDAALLFFFAAAGVRVLGPRVDDRAHPVGR